MSSPAEDPAWKKGTAEFLVLAQLAEGPSHGYDIARQISRRSLGALAFNAASLYPVLYRLERRGWIAGRWVEQAGERRRRFYRLTASGRRALADQRRGWEAFMEAVRRAGGLGYA
jgi:transcriptional regulator